MKNKKLLVLLITFLAFLSGVFYINTLDFKLYKHTINKNAQISIAVKKGSKTWTINKRNQPLLSVFKYIVALKVLDKIDKENISPDKKITITKFMISKSLYSPMLKEYKSFPFDISIADLLKYMISESDNNACDILIEYAGGINEIENFVHKLGYENIKISVTEKEMNAEIDKQYLNSAAAIDIVNLLKNTYEGNVLSKNSTDFLRKIMLDTHTGSNKLKAGLPENVKIGHKTGSSSRKPDGIKIADNDAGFVILPDGEIYYIAVFIQDSAMSDSENANLIRKISKTVYEYLIKNN